MQQLKIVRGLERRGGDRPVKRTHRINFAMSPQPGEMRYLLSPGALGVRGGQLTVNGRAVCLYEIGTDSVHYFSPSLSGALPSSEVALWADLLHRDDREWVLQVHKLAIAAGKGIELMFRYALRDGRVLWVVDRQEVLKDVDDRQASGISIDVTDLVLPVPRPRTAPTPLPIEVLIVPHPGATRSGPSATAEPTGRGHGTLPLGAEALSAWLDELNTRSSGSLVTSGDRRRGASPVLLSWAPLGEGIPQQLVALAIADIGEHLNASRAQHDRLRQLARSLGGTDAAPRPRGRAG